MVQSLKGVSNRSGGKAARGPDVLQTVRKAFTHHHRVRKKRRKPFSQCHFRQLSACWSLLCLIQFPRNPDLLSGGSAGGPE